MLNTLLLLIFPAAMIAAASLDFFTLTIPNKLTIGFAVLFVPAAFAVGMPLQDAAMHLAAGAAMLAIAFAFFAFGWIGGGDAKFFAATALWLGWGDLVVYVFWFSVLGGALTILLITARRTPLPALFGKEDWALRLHDSRNGVPYGIALSIAGLIVYPGTIWMSVFSSV